MDVAALTLDAGSDNDVSAIVLSLDIARLSFSLLNPKSDAGGATRAGVLEGAEVNAPTLDVNAHADNTATVNIIHGGVSDIEVNVAMPEAKTTHDVESFIGPADFNDTNPDPGLSGSITVADGPIGVHATALNHATAFDFGMSTGKIQVNVSLPTIDAGGSTTAHVGGRFTINRAVNVTADSTSTAKGDAVGINASEVNFDVSGAKAEEVPLAADQDVPAVAPPRTRGRFLRHRRTAFLQCRCVLCVRPSAVPEPARRSIPHQYRIKGRKSDS